MPEYYDLKISDEESKKFRVYTTSKGKYIIINGKRNYIEKDNIKETKLPFCELYKQELPDGYELPEYCMTNYIDLEDIICRHGKYYKGVEVFDVVTLLIRCCKKIDEKYFDCRGSFVYGRDMLLGQSYVKKSTYSEEISFRLKFNTRPPQYSGEVTFQMEWGDFILEGNVYRGNTFEKLIPDSYKNKEAD